MLYSTRRSPGRMRNVMTKHNGNSAPAYRKIQDWIATRIRRSKLKPGAKVESERELAKIHKVSLMTARHALAKLQQEGLVERHHGVGTFVAIPKIHFNKLTSFTENMQSRRLPANSRVLSSTIVQDGQDIAARLSLPTSSRLVMVERMRKAADEPFALETCYLSADRFADVAGAPLERASLFAFLEREHGLQLAHADEEIDATAADQRISKLLAIPRGTPLLRIRQIIYSTQGQAVLYVVGLYRSDRHTVRVRRFR